MKVLGDSTHPKIETLRQRIQQRIGQDSQAIIIKPEDSSKTLRPTWQKWLTRIGIGAVVILVACGGIWLATNWNWYFGDGRENYEKWWSITQVCIYLEVDEDYPEDLCNADTMMTLYPNAVDACYTRYGELERGDVGDNRPQVQWARCLIDEGALLG